MWPEQVKVPAPTWLAEHARRHADSGTEPATPRTAATVVLVRGASSGGTQHVFVQRRSATMAFAPNLYAFPGGSVDPRDTDVVTAWVGPDPQWWSRRLGLPERAARAVICAAVREVFEECGVLLAGPAGGGVVADAATDEWEAARVALLAREISLAELFARDGLAVRSDLLTPWARWLTPEFEPRRFDTFFFIARLPDGQRTRDVSGEADHVVWLPAAEAVELPMLPPTRHTLRRIAAHDDIETALAAAAEHDVTRPVMPRLLVDDEGVWLVTG